MVFLECSNSSNCTIKLSGLVFQCTMVDMLNRCFRINIVYTSLFPPSIFLFPKMPVLPVGSATHFPSIILKLVRSNLPPHQQTFLVPPYLTKPDLKALLMSMYTLETVDIRTMNYLGKRGKEVKGSLVGGKAAYKKCIVTFKDDFVWPEKPMVGDAIRMPPPVGQGRATGRKVRERIDAQAIERGIEIKSNSAVSA